MSSHIRLVPVNAFDPERYFQNHPELGSIRRTLLYHRFKSFEATLYTFDDAVQAPWMQGRYGVVTASPNCDSPLLFVHHGVGFIHLPLLRRLLDRAPTSPVVEDMFCVHYVPGTSKGRGVAAAYEEMSEIIRECPGNGGKHDPRLEESVPRSSIAVLCLTCAGGHHLLIPPISLTHGNIHWVTSAVGSASRSMNPCLGTSTSRAQGHLSSVPPPTGWIAQRSWVPPPTWWIGRRSSCTRHRTVRATRSASSGRRSGRSWTGGARVRGPCFRTASAATGCRLPHACRA